ncbi:MAG: NUDIX hydrolase [Eubacteriaceae bacterium]|nr:NUDIX hydrolase [Eubacteriaceae bacterium]
MTDRFSHLIEKTVSSQDVCDAKIFELKKLTVKLPDEKEAERYIIKHKGASCVLPIDGDDVIFVVQYRAAIGRIMLELPAGKLDSEDEDPYDCAVRELEEETGYNSRNMVFLRKYIPAAGYSSEVIHLYAATDLTRSAAHPDEDEFVDVVKIPMKKAYDMCVSGEIEDSKTVIAIMTYYERFIR